MYDETKRKEAEDLLKLASQYADAAQRATLPVAAEVLKQLAENYRLQASMFESGSTLYH